MQLQAVFVDRDGVLNKYVRADYIRNAEGMHLLDGAAEAVRKLNDRNVPVIVISNQQGVARGLMSRADLDGVDDALRSRLVAAGATLTRTYYCTHLKTDGCSCRKPKSGMIHQAAQDFGLDLARCVMIGDSLSDIRAGNGAPVAKSILVLSGSIAAVELKALSVEETPTAIARDLAAAVDLVLEDVDR